MVGIRKEARDASPRIVRNGATVATALVRGTVRCGCGEGYEPIYGNKTRAWGHGVRARRRGGGSVGDAATDQGLRAEGLRWFLGHRHGWRGRDLPRWGVTGPTHHSSRHPASDRDFLNEPPLTGPSLAVAWADRRASPSHSSAPHAVRASVMWLEITMLALPLHERLCQIPTSGASAYIVAHSCLGGTQSTVCLPDPCLGTAC
jgi:hypothetical protein